MAVNLKPGDVVFLVLPPAYVDYRQARIHRVTRDGVYIKGSRALYHVGKEIHFSWDEARQYALEKIRDQRNAVEAELVHLNHLMEESDCDT